MVYNTRYDKKGENIAMSKVRTRFAPSPTGRMHVGNLRTALYAYLITKHEGGDFILRIEDTDQERYVEGAVDIIYRTLAETGLIHDEGPDKDGGCGPYVQSERQAQGIYLEYAKKLIEKGEAYDILNTSYVIFICTFDFFESNKSMYEFENICINKPELKLNDGTHKIFLNTKGNRDGISEELQMLLDYFDGREPESQLPHSLLTEKMQER